MASLGIMQLALLLCDKLDLTSREHVMEEAKRLVNETNREREYVKKREHARVAALNAEKHRKEAAEFEQKKTRGEVGRDATYTPSPDIRERSIRIGIDINRCVYGSHTSQCSRAITPSQMDVMLNMHEIYPAFGRLICYRMICSHHAKRVVEEFSTSDAKEGGDKKIILWHLGHMSVIPLHSHDVQLAALLDEIRGYKDMSTTLTKLRRDASEHTPKSRTSAAAHEKFKCITPVINKKTGESRDCEKAVKEAGKRCAVHEKQYQDNLALTTASNKNNVEHRAKESQTGSSITKKVNVDHKKKK